MKNKGFVALIMIALLLISTMAIAGGNFYISGSRDGEGAVGTDGHSFEYIRGTTDIVMEGATSDAYEAIIRVPDPGSDIVYTMPAATGTLATTAGGDVTLTDEYLFVGSSSNLAVGVAVTGDINITNAGVTTIDLADTKLFVGSSAGLATAQTLSGDATIANTGAMTIGDNKIGDAELNITEHTIVIAAPATFGSATGVTAGSTIIGIIGIANINAANELPVTAILNTTTIYLDLLGAVDTDTLIYNVVTVAP